jgi:protein ImuA
MAMLAPSSQLDILEALRQQLEVRQRPAASSFSSGCDALDRVLPGHAFYRGTLIEYLADGGSGAVALALIAAREACRDGGALVIVDRSRSFNPPAAANLGIDTNTIFVRPRTRKDQLWTLHQSLSCRGVGAVLCWPDKLDGRAFRSLQLAAEDGGAVGLFSRTLGVRGHPTWSALQLLIEPLRAANKSRRLRVNVVRCQNGRAGAAVDLELDDETGKLNESRAVPLASPMAVTTSANRKAGA